MPGDERAIVHRNGRRAWRAAGLMRFPSPLRYPGGKGGLAPYLADLLEINDLTGCIYYEPYAGGAGAALNLLTRNAVSRVHINDADPRVAAMWRAVLEQTDRFVERIHEVPLTIDEWRRQHAVCVSTEARDGFALGFAAFYMNRCNRSGVLKGAGPIGGLAQAGKWRLDVRFNREELVARVRLLGSLRERIVVSDLDAIDFLVRSLPAGRGRARAFAYADPPYVIKGRSLYLNAYGPQDHAGLAEYLGRQNVLPWLVSYDDTPLIRSLYAAHQQEPLPIRYTLHEKRNAQELLIAPHRLYLPVSGRSVRGARIEAPTTGLHP